MPEEAKKIAFVSGKGGVGKTLLAANFAFCSSTNQRTVLIDLDFQNQGSSGLLSQYVSAGCANAFDLLMSDRAETENPIEIRKNLLFIPAFDPSKADRYGSQISAPFSGLDADALNEILDRILTTNDAQLVIMDCHGGLDDVSFSAFISSDITFIVTEADRVTFNGTLELLDFYIERAAAAYQQRNCSKMESEGKNDPTFARRCSNIEENKVSILVNRVSGRFSYDALQKVCTRQFYDNVHSLRQMNLGFFYFPVDPLAAESFSEHPFYMELMAESILAQKMELLYTTTLKQIPVIEGRSTFYRIFERKSPARLARYLKSPYESRMQAVFSFAMLAQLVFFLLTLVSIVLYAMYDPTQFERSFTVPFWVVMSIVLLFSARIDVQISGFFRDRLRYESRLYRRGGRPLSVPFLVRLIRLWSFRSFSLAAAVTFVLLALVSGLAMVLELFGGPPPMPPMQ
jgi:MinD-like ATPase involved in chromosome partitioning or flagellar assembly